MKVKYKKHKFGKIIPWLNLRAMKAYGGVERELQGFLTLTLDEDEWSDLGPCHFTSRKMATNTHRRGGCFEPKRRLGRCGEKSFFCGQSNRNYSVVQSIV
jgi:hypothetical protein